MPVANMADISPDLRYDHMIELLTEAYANRVNKKVTVFVFY